ncbi:hypothetical protein PN462_18575 [Spirulina sp. CS-785/01]|uniref:hypothetical protein n=1 Tax=Spirulina sp. CS-785/01 TaxID=3021716 RepID=UPI00232B6E7F|nr:hypothetical protein [Spirulina sp. CS-785/01]MDB9315127.1 hypothetical protein [Spirulina sp. CS-785/01]
MEALSFTHMALAEDDAEFLAAREIKLPVKETTSLVLVATLQGGYVQGSEPFTSQTVQQTVKGEKVAKTAPLVPSQREDTFQEFQDIDGQGDNTTQWTVPPNRIEKNAPVEPSSEQDLARLSRSYPRPYYSRARLPEELKISPFHLVNRAYRGGYKDSGIPSYGVFVTAYRSGQLDAKDLIRAGVIQGRLTTADLYDPTYINAVKSQLEGLTMP